MANFVKSIFFIDNSPSTKYNLVKAIGTYDNLFGKAPEFRYVLYLSLWGKTKSWASLGQLLGISLRWVGTHVFPMSMAWSISLVLVRTHY
jgi:hypothetical protein